MTILFFAIKAVASLCAVDYGFSIFKQTANHRPSRFEEPMVPGVVLVSAAIGACLTLALLAAIWVLP